MVRLLIRLCLTLSLVLVPGSGHVIGEEDYADERQAMVETVADMAKWVGDQKRVPGVFDPAVMAALGTVPRHAFVPKSQRDNAYENRPLAIGYGQTISQPYIVALMSDLLDLESGAKVLELGTGSGYQAAILAAMGMEVSSIEIVPQLAGRAAQALQNQGFKTVEVRNGDGYYGWPEKAPFDGVIVTAAARHIPPALVDQLKPGGRMVIPVGPPFLTQSLVLVHKDQDGGVRSEALLPVTFVPLTGAGG